MKNFSEKSNFADPSSESYKPIQISSLSDKILLEKYDIFLLDAYGVLYNGSKPIENTINAVNSLIKENKKVCIFSNTTQLGCDAKLRYKDKGVYIEGLSYITLGDYYRHLILSGELEKKILKAKNGNVKEIGKIKVYNFGYPRRELFKDSNFDLVDKLKDADCVFLGIAQFTTEERDMILKEYPGYCEYFKLSDLPKPGESERWDVIEEHPEVFYQYLDNFISLGLPILNANTDRSAPEKERGTENINQVVRNGILIEYIESKNGIVFNGFGKPNTKYLEFTIKRLCGSETKLNELTEKILVVGDTPETDVLVAKNSNTDSVLVAKIGKKCGDLVPTYVLYE